MARISAIKFSIYINNALYYKLLPKHRVLYLIGEMYVITTLGGENELEYIIQSNIRYLGQG